MNILRQLLWPVGCIAAITVSFIGVLAFYVVFNPTKDVLHAQWDMPGSTKTATGLVITHTGRSIVQQDGSGGQPNPAINYPTYLKVKGDFKLAAAVAERRGAAMLRFYAKPPMVQDEFLVEPPSILLTIQSDRLVVKLWDGKVAANLAAQQPTLERDWPITDSSTPIISIQRTGTTLVFNVNDTDVGTIPDSDIFAGGEVWLGADAEQSWRLTSLTAEGINGGTVQLQQPLYRKLPRDPRGLQALAEHKRPGFLIGTAAGPYALTGYQDYAGLVAGNFGAMTAENALKWQFVHPQPTLYTFAEADALVDFARQHHLAVHGHTLVFGEANPHWVQELPLGTDSDRGQVKQIMVDHIKTVMLHFKDIQSWDVINEPLAADMGPSLRRHIWYQAMGEDYIATALLAARQANPTAQLFINEFGLEADSQRWDAFLKLVGGLKQAGVPLDGVGFEAHVYEPRDEINPGVLRTHINQLAALGLKSRISEMDVTAQNGPDWQAAQYTDILAVCIDEPACISFTTWGADNRFNLWQDEQHRLHYGKDFLWNDPQHPTKAVEQLKQLLNQ